MLHSGLAWIRGQAQAEPDCHSYKFGSRQGWQWQGGSAEGQSWLVTPRALSPAAPGPEQKHQGDFQRAAPAAEPCKLSWEGEDVPQLKHDRETGEC